MFAFGASTSNTRTAYCFGELQVHQHLDSMGTFDVLMQVAFRSAARVICRNSSRVESSPELNFEQAISPTPFNNAAGLFHGQVRH
jgi:hypothetical protein